MCGIYGTTISYKDYQIKQKIDRLKHRGPNYSGYERLKTQKDEILTLGHTRLSIIDLESRSNQPFCYEKKVHIVYNGEVYNFKEIRRHLLNKGYNFYTASDTEVICAAYLEYGVGCLEHFEGMFAFVIYDIEKNILFGARDRTGQKPLYYSTLGNTIEFASQISSIRDFNNNITISSDSIVKFLTWGNVPDPLSIYNEIKKLKAGCFFTYNLDSNQIKVERFWDIDFQGENLFLGSYLEAKDILTNLLSESVTKRLYADVPVGVFLSGGIDSSLIAALAINNTRDVNTFSVKFNERAVDESLFAQRIAKHLGTNHHVIECNLKEGLDLIDNFYKFYDEPFADSSAIPTMLLSKYTKSHVTVALSGDGGDESFLGYSRYEWIKYLNLLYKLPLSSRRLMEKLLSALPFYKANVVGSTLGNRNIEETYLNLMTSRSPIINLTGHNKPSLVDETSYLFHHKKNLYERISDFDLKTYLNWTINTKVDRGSMAYSLEVRSPLLDHKIIEFGRTLPTPFKFENKMQKRILKDILYDHVPKKYFDRPKSGFTMPLKHWFRTHLKEFIMDELYEANLEYIPGLNAQVIPDVITDHLTKKANNSASIWKLFVLKQWLNNYGGGCSIT